MNTLLAIPNVSCPQIPVDCSMAIPGCPCTLPGVVSVTPAPVPSLSLWAMLVLAGLLALVGARAAR